LPTENLKIIKEVFSGSVWGLSTTTKASVSEADTYVSFEESTTINIANMLTTGPALKVTIHINADISSRTNFLHEEILQLLMERGIAGATLLRVQVGFGSHHRMHTEGAAGVEGEHLPVRIEFIECKETVNAILPALYELVSDGVIEAQNITILKVTTGKSQLP
jgi:uncharacterized protein